MNTFRFICHQYLKNCYDNLHSDSEIIDFLSQHGVARIQILDNFKIGYAPGKTAGDYFANSLVIPLFDTRLKITNIAGYRIINHPHNQFNTLNSGGIFNQNHLKHCREIILTDNPITALFLIQNGFRNTTFLFGDLKKYLPFFLENKCRSIISTFISHQKLLYYFSQNGITIRQAGLINKQTTNEYLDIIISKAVPVIFKRIEGVAVWPIKK